VKNQGKNVLVEFYFEKRIGKCSEILCEDYAFHVV